jgi:hypothetical protein
MTTSLASAVVPKNAATLRAVSFLRITNPSRFDCRTLGHAEECGAKNPYSKYIDVHAGHLTLLCAA